MKLRGAPPWALLAAIFLASFAVIHGWSGTWPALWLDTLNDQREVKRCVLEGSCSLLGQAASIDGLFVAGGWLHLRSLLFALGLGLDGVHLLLQVLDALGVALVALAGVRLGGRGLGAAAAFVLVWELGQSGATREAIYNTSPLAFLGAVLLLACLAAVERPGLWPSVLTGLLGAVMTDIHTACAPVGLTVVGVALLAPGRRVVRAAAAGAAFAALAFAMAPLQWIENVRFLVTRGGGAPPGGGGTAPLAAIARALDGDMIARWALLAVGAWLCCAVARRTALRRRLDVPMAIAAPMLAAFVLGVGHGVGDSGGKYLVHIKAAAALGGMVPLWAAARWLAEPVLGRFEPVVLRLVPWVAALGILTAPEKRRDALGFPFFTMGDVEAFARDLGGRRGWSRARVQRRVQAVDQQTVLTALLEEEGASFREPGPNDDDDLTTALLLEVDAAELPDPLPAGWTVARRAQGHAAVLILARSRLDWRLFSLCAGEGDAQRCVRERDLGPDSAPPPLPDRGPMVLRVPLARGSDAPPGRLFMPRLREVCGGRIVSVPGPASRLAADGRHANLVADPTAADPGEVVLAWDVGSPACPANFARPRPPFFLEADAATAPALEAMMARRER